MAEPFNHLCSRAVYLELANIDTDQIIPARFMRTPRNEGYGRFLFHDLRFRGDGSPESAFVLNLSANRNVQILLAGPNFGCGSSREAAVYALYDFGVRCIIAPSFGEIFQNNCSKNGILPVVLSHQIVQDLAAPAAQEERIEVDLPGQTVRKGATGYRFAIDTASKASLLTGLDDIETTLRLSDRIAAFLESRLARHPWIVPVLETRSKSEF